MKNRRRGPGRAVYRRARRVAGRMADKPLDPLVWLHTAQTGWWDSLLVSALLFGLSFMRASCHLA
eukprot:1162117-Pelagomonas_calceolata.AAC.3